MNDDLKYTAPVTQEQFDKLPEDVQLSCVSKDSKKTPYAIPLVISSSDVESGLDSMDAETLRSNAKKTYIGALQREGRLDVFVKYGLVEKSERFKAHDNKMYLEAKKTLDSLYASKALSDEGYAIGLLTLKESFGIDQ